MKKVSYVFFAYLFFWIGMESIAADLVSSAFVSADSLNVRSEPNGEIISKLSRGVSVNVYDKSGDWARLSDSNSSPKWVHSKFLCSDVDCWKEKKTSTASRNKNAVSIPRLEYSDYECPCSSSSNCYGPRGGRYCITSGGRKRYR